MAAIAPPPSAAGDTDAALAPEPLLGTVLDPSQVLRDEFSCPITCELIHEPVIAADGHTYDRDGIERWLNSHGTSPKTGKELEHLNLVVNHNLKRLIDDLVQEGGAGLYTPPQPDTPALAADGGAARVLVRERLLVMRCSESSAADQRGRAFRIPQAGAEGGRRRRSEAVGRHFVQVSEDKNVSRQHFDISYNAGAGANAGMFRIRDVGSASGTFLRVSHGEGRPLYPGDMFRLGRHELLVEAGPAGGLRLRCVAPEGSPLQSSEYEVGANGATLGRNKSSSVCFAVDVDGVAMGIDQAISSAHARVACVPGSSPRAYVLLDGSADRPSSNGTWFRMSPMHEQSRHFPLVEGTELLVGPSRFTVSIEETVVEVEVASGGGGVFGGCADQPGGHSR